MRVSLEWLSEYIDLACDVEETADILTMAGLEVEGIDYRGISFEDIVTARIESREDHPEADNLSILTASTGTGRYTIVCGDRNIREGDLVPLALPGSRLQGGREVMRTKIRGIDSEGMLCSEKELGITEDATGVMILPHDTKPGINLSEALAGMAPRIDIAESAMPKKGRRGAGYSDSIFEVGLTPNRPDCLSVFGFARELSALLDKPVIPPVTGFEEGNSRVREDINVVIEEPLLCNRYTARVIKGVRTGKSPLWLRRRLEAAGVRAINNLVDVTNYVMLELGQPLHAFDLGRIDGKNIVVRKAGSGEKLTTLDGVERTFDGGELLICDAKKALALAGIIGGEESAVSESTRDILLESAYFEPASVRKTARNMGLHTESSHRFERGVDKEGVAAALDRMTTLILQLAGGEVSSGYIDVYPVPYEGREIVFRPERCRRLLGLDMGDEEIIGFIRSLNMEVSHSEDRYTVVPPSYRVDIDREIDLVEEVARLKGYNSIPEEKITGAMPEPVTEDEGLDTVDIKKIMAASGFNEVINYCFQSPHELDRLMVNEKSSLRETISILNPISEEMSVMRSTLIPGILNTVAANINRQNRNMRLFELGKVFFRKGGDYNEASRLCGLITGEKSPLLWRKAADIYDLKGTLENLLDLLNVRDYTFKNYSDIPWMQSGRGARVYVKGIEIGILGAMHPAVLDNYGIGQDIFMFDLDIDAVCKLTRSNMVVRDIPVYPFIERDVALLVDTSVTLSDITDICNKMETPFVENLEVFDQFAGQGIGEGKKSLAIRIRYRSAEKTLTDEEVNNLHESIISNIAGSVGATVR